MIYPIRTYGDPVLRQTASPVARFGEELERLAADMLETMYDANGVGLAAPQIGLAKRIFVALELGEADDAELPDEAAEDDDGRWGVVAEHVMVNPEIVERSGLQVAQDGCLSLPGLYVEEMRRDLRVRVRYRDLRGEPRELEAEGHFAHVIQHETDHLDGVLFFDRLPDAERRAFLDEHRAELAQMQRDAKALLKRLRDAPAEIRV